jgi:hypothetical protein
LKIDDAILRTSHPASVDTYFAHFNHMWWKG